MSTVLPRAALRTLLGYATATGNYLAGCHLHLYANQVTLTPLTTLSSLTEASFQGYAAVTTVTWNAPYTDIAGNAVISAGLSQFECTGTTTPNTIYGWYLTDATNATLLAAAALPTPVSITQVGDAVLVAPTCSQGQPPD